MRCPLAPPTAAQRRRALGMPTNSKPAKRRAALVAALAASAPLHWRRNGRTLAARYASPAQAQVAAKRLAKLGATVQRKGTALLASMP